MCQLVLQVLNYRSLSSRESFFIYNENDLSDEAQFWKAQLVKFINNIGYIRGVSLMTEVDKKRLKCLIGI